MTEESHPLSPTTEILHCVQNDSGVTEILRFAQDDRGVTEIATGLMPLALTNPPLILSLSKDFPFILSPLEGES